MNEENNLNEIDNTKYISRLVQPSTEIEGKEEEYYIRDLDSYSTASNNSKRLNELEVIVDSNYTTLINHVENKFNSLDYQKEISWSDLCDLRNREELIPGMKYRIIDYTTTTAKEGTSSAKHDFDIIVEAINKNKLSEIAKASQRKGDTYFENSNLNKWQIWYCLDNDTSRFDWADTINGKGVIYRMIDEWDNDCPYDFKNMILSYYLPIYCINDYSNYALRSSLTFSGTIPNTDATVLKDYIVKSNIIRERVVSGIQSLNSNHFLCSPSPTIGNTIGYGSYHNIIGYGCSYNEIGNECTYNIIGLYPTQDGGSIISPLFSDLGGKFPNNLDDLTIEGIQAYLPFPTSNTEDNVLSSFNKNIKDKITGFYTNIESFRSPGKCYYNRLLGRNKGNIICGEGSSYNTLGIDCNYNYFICKQRYSESDLGITYCNLGDLSYNNIFLNKARQNTLGKYSRFNFFSDSSFNILNNNCNCNYFGPNSNGNILNNSCKYNVFHESNDYNKLGNNVWYSYFGSSSSNNIIGNNTSTTFLFDECSFNNLGNDCGYLIDNKRKGNILKDSCKDNTFDQTSILNILNSGSSDNYFYTGASSNKLGNYCKNNIFKPKALYNTLGDNSCNNTVGNRSEYIELGNYCNNNEIASGCARIKLWDSCNDNTFGPGCGGRGNYININIGSNCNHCSIGPGCKVIHIAHHCDYINIQNSYGIFIGLLTGQQSISGYFNGDILNSGNCLSISVTNSGSRLIGTMLKDNISISIYNNNNLNTDNDRRLQNINIKNVRTNILIPYTPELFGDEIYERIGNNVNYYDV